MKSKKLLKISIYNPFRLQYNINVVKIIDYTNRLACTSGRVLADIPHKKYRLTSLYNHIAGYVCIDLFVNEEE